MFNFDKAQRTVAAMVAALVFTTVSVSAAVGPARAVETAPVLYAQVQVAGQANG